MEQVKGFAERWRVGRFVVILTLAMSAYHLITGGLGTPIAEIHLPVHLAFALVILFWMNREKASGRRAYLLIGRDCVFSAMAIAGCGYLALNVETVQQRMLYFDPLTTAQLVFGCMLIMTILEAARRVIGWPLVVLGVAFLAYAMFGDMLPHPFWHRGYTTADIIETAYLTQDGIWTTPLRVTATYVFLFVLFGSFLVASGAGTFFTDVARSLTGRFTGGAAKTAIASSAFMGMLSGSSAANVVVTGSFTIPTMRRAGYQPQFAAGVEAVASSGGQFMPPIMGSAAFIMAEFIGVPYIEIAAAAVVPALLYFLSVMAMVDFEARRLGLTREWSAEAFLPILLARGYLLIPVVVLIGVLAAGYTPTLAALYGLASLVGLQLVCDGSLRRRFLSYCATAMDEAPRVIGQVTVASAVGGIIVGVVTQTGLGLRMSSIVLSVAQDSLPILLGLTMLSGIVLGMGMPTPAAYVILAALLAPGMVEYGVPVIAAHLFVMYCAGISAITPPVALASYAAAAVGNTDPWRTSLTAFRLGLGSFIVPYMFVYGPSLLGLGSSTQMMLNGLTASLGVLALAAALIGWLFVEIGGALRLVLFTSALLLIKPGVMTDGCGIALIVVACLIAWRMARNRALHPARAVVNETE